MNTKRELRVSFWLVYLVLFLVCVRNVLADDWLLTIPVAVLSVSLIVLCFLRPVASERRWSAVVALLFSMVVMAVVLRKFVWVQEYSLVDKRVLFLIGLSLIAITGRLTHPWRMRRRLHRLRSRRPPQTRSSQKRRSARKRRK